METLWLGTALHFKLHRTKNCLIRSTTLDGNFEVVTVQVHTETFCYGTEICNAQEGNIAINRKPTCVLPRFNTYDIKESHYALQKTATLH